MATDKLTELPIHHVTIVPDGCTLVFQVERSTLDVDIPGIVETVRTSFPGRRCVVLRGVTLFAATEILAPTREAGLVVRTKGAE